MFPYTLFLISYASAWLRKLCILSQPHLPALDSIWLGNQVGWFNQSVVRETYTLTWLEAFFFLLWVDEILHQIETIGNHCLLVFTGEASPQGFLGGAGFRPLATILYKHEAQNPIATSLVVISRRDLNLLTVFLKGILQFGPKR